MRVRAVCLVRKSRDRIFSREEREPHAYKKGKKKEARVTGHGVFVVSRFGQLSHHPPAAATRLRRRIGTRGRS